MYAEESYNIPFDSEDYLGFRMFKKLQKAAQKGNKIGRRFKAFRMGSDLLHNATQRGIGMIPNQHAQDFAQRLANAHFDDDLGFEDESGFDESEFDGFGKLFKRKPGGTKFGNLLRKGAQIGAGIASNIPGVGTVIGALPIGQGLMMKPAIQANPVEATAAAQTPQQAAAVVDAIAPNLGPKSREAATNDILTANSPGSAGKVVEELNRANEQAQKAKESKKTFYFIGAGIGGMLLLILIVWLIVRK